MTTNQYQRYLKQIEELRMPHTDVLKTFYPLEYSKVPLELLMPENTPLLFKYLSHEKED